MVPEGSQTNPSPLVPRARRSASRRRAWAASATFYSNVEVPSENDVCVWQSTIGVDMRASRACACRDTMETGGSRPCAGVPPLHSIG